MQLVAAWSTASPFFVSLSSHFPGWTSVSCRFLPGNSYTYLFIFQLTSTQTEWDRKSRICIFNARTNHAQM